MGRMQRKPLHRRVMRPRQAGGSVWGKVLGGCGVAGSVQGVYVSECPLASLGWAGSAARGGWEKAGLAWGAVGLGWVGQVGNMATAGRGLPWRGWGGSEFRRFPGGGCPVCVGRGRRQQRGDQGGGLPQIPTCELVLWVGQGSRSLGSMLLPFFRPPNCNGRDVAACQHLSTHDHI